MGGSWHRGQAWRRHQRSAAGGTKPMSGTVISIFLPMRKQAGQGDELARSETDCRNTPIVLRSSKQPRPCRAALLFAGLFHGHGNLEHGTSHALGFFGGNAGHLHASILDLAQFGEDRAAPLRHTVLRVIAPSSSRVCSSSSRSLMGVSSVYCSSAARARVRITNLKPEIGDSRRSSMRNMLVPPDLANVEVCIRARINRQPKNSKQIPRRPEGLLVMTKVGDLQRRIQWQAKSQ